MAFPFRPIAVGFRYTSFLFAVSVSCPAHVIDRDATVVTAFVDPDYTKRLEPSEMIDALRALTVGTPQG